MITPDSRTLLRDLLEAQTALVRSLPEHPVGSAERRALLAKRARLQREVQDRMTEPEPERGPRPGDRCFYVKDGTQVEHLGCDMYADGVRSDVRTGKVTNR